ncbi:uncharacterized protein LOC111269722 isoform X2 [Varroa jacobsoni]|uniref:Uncharacterized protein n=1 Tax=Varroa destructor TaxID=109461 RepID=A0A7M7KSH0_VARDE|nr:uncharacterized protein LOC111253271 isoform X2 [Varroa destructor]XP_022705267.1 uncharacterized protein LOC111269722 isoform X2 [Varroa jacobsoni]
MFLLYSCPSPGSIAISGLNRQGTSIETCSVSSLTQASGSITAISQQEWPTRPVPCRALVEANSSLAKGIQEAAALPYTVAIKEIDDIALDLVRGQQLVDDVYRVLESVSESLQYIEWEADELRAQGTVALPVPPPRHGYGGCHAPKPPTCPEQK